LAFVVYPAAIREVEFGVNPTIMGLMFFGMIISLGIDSMLAMHETITTTILDHFPFLWRYQKWVVMSTCAIGFLGGLIYCTHGGEALLTLVDIANMSWNLLVIALLECILLSWIYGADNLLTNIEEMSVKIPTAMKWYWKTCWMYITPGILCILLSQFDIEKGITVAYAITLILVGLAIFILDEILPNVSESLANSKALMWFQKIFKTLGVILVAMSFIIQVYFDYNDEDKYVQKGDFLRNKEDGPEKEKEKHTANVFGRCILYSSLLIIPIMSLWNVGKRYYYGKMEGQSLTKSLFQPTDKWIPNRNQFESEDNQIQASA